VKFLIIDDHRMFCDGLKLIFSQRDDQPTVFEADHCAAGFEHARAHPDIDLVMLDISLPDMDGHDALKVFSKQFPTLPVIMLTASESRHIMRRCFDAGASGYIPKSSSAEVMMSAIQLVLAGGIYVPPSLTITGTLPHSNRNTPVDLETLGKLTGRQAEVLSHLQDGISNKQIAERLSLSEATVKVHISAILKALGLRSRVEAALIAQKLDWQSV
jgi:DNA-binding NarL/FixJ family response regulator